MRRRSSDCCGGVIRFGHETTSSCLLPAERLAEHFWNAQRVWVDDSRILIPIDQPKILTGYLVTFLTVHT